MNSYIVDIVCVICIFSMSIGCDSDDGDLAIPLVIEGEWSLLSLPETSAECSQVYVVAPDAELLVGDHRSGARNSAPQTFPVEVSIIDSSGVSTAVELSCQVTLSASSSEMDSLLCAGETPFFVNPIGEVDAAWPLRIEIDAVLSLLAPCNIDDDEVLQFDYAGFMGSWHAYLSGICEGTECSEAQSEYGLTQGGCVQSLSIESKWSGCGDGTGACVDYFGQSCE